MKFNNPVFFVPANGTRVPSILDMAMLNDAGVYVGQYGGRTLEQLATAYVQIIEIGECDTVVATIEEMSKTEPVEIDEARYMEKLEVLPPEDWQSDRAGSSFKMMEYLSGRITMIYAHVGQRYFSFADLASLPHESILAKVNAYLAKTEVLTASTL